MQTEEIKHVNHNINVNLILKYLINFKNSS